MLRRIGVLRYSGWLALWVAACSGQPSVPGQNQQVGGMSGGGESGIATGGTLGTGGATAGHSGGSSSVLVNCGTNPMRTLLTKSSATGTGACANVTVATFLLAIHALNPQMPGVATLSTCPDSSGIIGVSSGVYAYRTACGSLQIVIWQGSGDCPSGCIDNEYWYFDSDTNCQPVQVRHLTNAVNGCAW